MAKKRRSYRRAEQRFAFYGDISRTEVRIFSNIQRLYEFTAARAPRDSRKSAALFVYSRIQKYAFYLVRNARIRIPAHTDEKKHKNTAKNGGTESSPYPEPFLPVPPHKNSQFVRFYKIFMFFDLKIHYYVIFRRFALQSAPSERPHSAARPRRRL